MTSRTHACSLGLVVYQAMSREELPVSGERWMELRHGGVGEEEESED